MNWGLFWTAIAAFAAVLTAATPLFLGYRHALKRQANENLERSRADNRTLREEIQRLRGDLDTRLRLPSFALDTLRLTDEAAARQIADLEERFRAAKGAHDQESAATLANQIEEANGLREQLQQVDGERRRLDVALRTLLTKRPRVTENAVMLPTGMILVVRHAGKYGAIQAVEQSNAGPRPFVRYAWWYQADGRGVFNGAGVQRGFGEVEEVRPGPSPALRLGPLQLEWSAGGWVYFGPPDHHSIEYELAVADTIDINKLNAGSLQFARYVPENRSHRIIRSQGEMDEFLQEITEESRKRFEDLRLNEW